MFFLHPFFFDMELSINQSELSFLYRNQYTHKGNVVPLFFLTIELSIQDDGPFYWTKEITVPLFRHIISVH